MAIGESEPLMPNWTTSEWATILSALFTALAASAACAAVLLEVSRDRNRHEPNVSAVPGQPTTGARPVITFANAGPGLAVALIYFGVEGEFHYQGGVGMGHLLPIDSHAQEILLPGFAGSHATFIWACRDVRGKHHLWASDGRHSAWTPRPGEWPTAEEGFRKMFPDVDVPTNALISMPRFGGS